MGPVSEKSLPSSKFLFRFIFKVLKRHDIENQTLWKIKKEFLSSKNSLHVLRARLRFLHSQYCSMILYRKEGGYDIQEVLATWEEKAL